VAGVAIGLTVIGAGTRHLPPSWIHAPVTLTLAWGRPETDVRDGCFRGRGQVSGEQMSGHVMLTGGRGLWTTATAAVGPQC